MEPALNVFYEMRGAACKFGLVNSASGGIGAVFVNIMIVRVAALFRRDRIGVMSDTSKLERVFQFLRKFLAVRVFLERRLLSRHLRGRCCTQKTDVLALVMRCGVQLLLTRGTTEPSSTNTLKTKLKPGSSAPNYTATKVPTGVDRALRSCYVNEKGRLVIEIVHGHGSKSITTCYCRECYIRHTGRREDSTAQFR